MDSWANGKTQHKTTIDVSNITPIIMPILVKIPFNVMVFIQSHQELLSAPIFVFCTCSFLKFFNFSSALVKFPSAPVCIRMIGQHSSPIHLHAPCSSVNIVSNMNLFCNALLLLLYYSTFWYSSGIPCASWFHDTYTCSSSFHADSASLFVLVKFVGKLSTVKGPVSMTDTQIPVHFFSLFHNTKTHLIPKLHTSYTVTRHHLSSSSCATTSGHLAPLSRQCAAPSRVAQ